MKIVVVGGGIAGLAFALQLHKLGMGCEVFESVPEVREIGVGITLLPHAMRELTALGLLDELRAHAIENEDSLFFNRYGQFIYREPRGVHAGYPFPELGIHRGRLHRILFDAVLERVGAAHVHTDRRCLGLTQQGSSVTLAFEQTSSGVKLAPVQGDVVVACDGVNSTVRRRYYPDEAMAFGGINTWRGVTRHKPILGGKSYMRVGSIETGKMVIYPIAEMGDGSGDQLINWVAEIRQDVSARNDWNQPGRLDAVLPIFKDWHFDWLDVPALIEGADQVLEYPMVDKDPVPKWTFGRVTLMGDAAHPMYPRGSNGAAQAILDGIALAEQLHAQTDPSAALLAYERLRLEPTARIVRTNRAVPPDFIITKVDELSGGKPFRSIDDLISQQELRQISEHYKQIAGFSLSAVERG
jgi:2-polyprenyl-6-methoxyphenol hydroxylase-like FAD-dependent oxidoreductase